MAEDDLALSEPIPITEIFVTGFLDPEDCGDYVRITYYAERPCFLDGEKTTERAVVARIIFTKPHYRRAVAGVLERHGQKRPPAAPNLTLVR